MSDDKNHDMIPAILSAAIAAAGPKGSNDAAWKAKINQAIPDIAVMMNDRSHQWRTAAAVLDAAVFVATYVSHAVEQSSTRVVVQIDSGRPSKNYPDGIEPIRTHRTDTAAGKHMLARLEHLNAGDEIVIWKSIESSEDGTEKYRTLVHFEPAFKRTNSPSRPATAHQGDGQPVESSAPPAEDSGPRRSPDDYTDQIDSERIVGWRHATIERLTDEQFEAVKKALSKQGYDFYGVSEIEWVEHVRPVIREVVASGRDEE